jgi:hypothetical protein
VVGKERFHSVIALTHLPEARDKKNWIRASENYERIWLNKIEIFSKFGFRASR